MTASRFMLILPLSLSRLARCFVTYPNGKQEAFGLMRPCRLSIIRQQQPAARIWLATTADSHLLNGTDSDCIHSWESETDDDKSLEEQSSATADDDRDDPLLLEEYHQWAKAVDAAMGALEKKKASLQSEWVKAQGVEETVARAQLIVSNLYQFPHPGVRTATVQDWENGGEPMQLTLDPQYESASAEADALFAQARKLKRGSKVIQGLLDETERAMGQLKDAQMDLEAALLSGDSVEEGRLRLVQDRLRLTAHTTKFRIPNPSGESSRRSNKKPPSSSSSSSSSSEPPNVRKLKTPAGCPVLVGRNRRGNEYLSFQVARGKDIWMHARGCPGAHVLIQVRRGGTTPTEECLQFAADLAVFYSDARTERKAPVTAAEPKHLLKPRGAPPGAVKLREEWRVLMGRPDEVPEGLKLAREDSGLSDEYRSTDKAKHRRRTQQVAKQNQAKKRAENRAKKKRRSSTEERDLRVSE